MIRWLITRFPDKFNSQDMGLDWIGLGLWPYDYSEIWHASQQHYYSAVNFQVYTLFQNTISWLSDLTHWGRVTHICVRKVTIIGSDNGLSPHRRHAIIQTNAEILLIRPLGTKFSEILIKFKMFSFKKMHLIMSSANGGHFVSASMC